ncbi:MAG TPA: hypothetical protein DCG12_02555 [Planctomycetaceae bacterium]|nr:hypothetical protein [Planctomycetaceae bacterium]
MVRIQTETEIDNRSVFALNPENSIDGPTPSRLHNSLFPEGMVTVVTNHLPCLASGLLQTISEAST